VGVVFNLKGEKYEVIAVAYKTPRQNVLEHFCMLHFKPRSGRSNPSDPIRLTALARIDSDPKNQRSDWIAWN